MRLLINVLNIFLIAYSFILIVLRVLSNSGLKIKNIITTSSKLRNSDNTNILKKIFIYSLLFRITIFLISIVVYHIFLNSESLNMSNIIDNYIKWDAINYIRISHSYSFHIENGIYTTLAFFPLYSLLIKTLNIFVEYRELCGLIISFICYSLACVYIYKLVILDYNKNIAYKTIILISIFPFSFFFGTIMSESTFLLFSTITLYHIRKHNWFLSGIFGFLSSLSRMAGVLLIIPAIVELFETYKPFKNHAVKDILKILKKFSLLLIILGGFITYILINKYYTGDFLYFTKIQKIIWGETFTPPYLFLYNLINLIKNSDTTLSFTIFIPTLFSVIFMYTLLLTNLKRQKTMYLSWLLVYILINTSLSWPLSLGRYFTCALPAYIFLANYLQKRKQIHYTFTIIIFSILFTIFFVAYLMYKQVM